MTANSPAKSAQFRIRRRTEADLEACVRVLATVHERNGYPLNWPQDPATWLTPRSLLAVWVAEEGEEVVGHIVLSRSEEGDAAAALYERLGWTLLAADVEQEWGPARKVTVRCYAAPTVQQTVGCA
ncbi:hypothetical protein ACFYXF_26725 [Streptomyces sp. NPDC002680]|uniref:hypothetical protein n=1 Tax=Streptomyces sp. NPDC002680 TaxID=3364659 RepID=UPI00368F33B3